MNQTEEYDARIIAGAAELFRNYGIRAVTMDSIATHLGISKRTIYERFHDKDELLYAVMNDMIQKQKEMVENILNTSSNVMEAVFTVIRIGREHMSSMNPLIGSDLRKYHDSVLQRIKDNCDNPDYEGNRKMLQAGIAQGLFRDDIDIEIISRAVTGLGGIVSDTNRFPPEQFTQRDLIRNIIINYLRGISTARGNKLIDEMEPGF
ncbi:TetR/AcrR family transcriptional regulator [bacterium]|jgi:AcrR family transcriptional regulator|nr:TetR/AcrR family transcriptional regulator [bacterium]